MTQNAIRVAIPTGENEVDEIKLGLAYLYKYAKDNPDSIKSPALFIPAPLCANISETFTSH